VARVAEQYLVETNRTEGLLLPHRGASSAVIPASPDPDSLLADLQQQATEPADAEEPLALEEIKERVIRMTVPPGIELALLPKRTREEMVYGEMRFRYGTEADLTGHSTALRLLPSLLMRGTRKLDHAALRSQIDLFQSDIELGGLEGVLSVSITTDRQHLIPCLELLAQILTEPAFDPDEFEIVRRDRLGRLRASLSSPVDQTFTALRRSLYPWPETSIHYMPTIEEEIARVEALSLDTIKRLYRRHLGASHAEACVVGDFDQGKVMASVGRLFGAWECATPYERISMPHLPIIAGEESICIPDQSMAIAALATALELSEDDPAYPALKLASHIFVEGDRSRLHDRLREAMALSYHTGGRLRAEVDDRSTYFFAYAFCTPDSAGRALEAMRSELDRMVRAGITERELEEARSLLNQKLEMDLASDAFLSREIVQGLEHDRCFSTYPDLLERMRNLTVAEVGSVLETTLGSVPLASVVAGDLPRRPQ
jgi:zinc protease